MVSHPALNAILNATSGALLCAGFLFIRKKKIVPHKLCMGAAFLCSTAFLISYVMYHLQVGSVKFTGQGWIRPVYFTILISHTVLAATIPFLALIVLYRAFRAQFTKHRWIARWTLPVWFYVSITGVIVYVMLYRLYPAAR